MISLSVTGIYDTSAFLVAKSFTGWRGKVSLQEAFESNLVVGLAATPLRSVVSGCRLNPHLNMQTAVHIDVHLIEQIRRYSCSSTLDL